MNKNTRALAKAARLKRKELLKRRQVQAKSPARVVSDTVTGMTGSKVAGLGFGLLVAWFGQALGVSIEIEHEPPAAPALPPPADDLELNPVTGAFEPKK